MEFAVSTLFSQLHGMIPAGDASSSNQPLDDIYIICIGDTGCGSSTFINHLIDGSTQPDLEKMKVADQANDETSLGSCTKSITWTQLSPNDPESLPLSRQYNLWFGDIPGFDSTDTRLGDDVIVLEIVKSLRSRLQPLAQSGRGRSGIGILLLQGIEDQHRLLKSLKEINKGTVSRALKHMTVVTTKWRGYSPPGNEAASSGEGHPTPNAGEDKYKRNQNQIATSLSGITDAGAVLVACRGPGDEWRIVEDLVRRVEAEANRAAEQAQSETTVAPPPQKPPPTKSDLPSWFRWMNCCGCSSMEEA